MAMYKAIIKREESTTLQLLVGDTPFDIVLTEDKPNDVKNVFNKLLEKLKSGEFTFTLEDTKEDLYHHISKEYLKQLNVELKAVYSELKDNGLLVEEQS